MRVRVLFRHDVNKASPFEKALIDLISYSSDNADTLIISSGYITSNIVWDFNSNTNKMTLANAICNGLPNGGKVILIAGKFEKWNKSLQERHPKNLTNTKMCRYKTSDTDLCNQHAISKGDWQYCYLCEYYHFLKHLKVQIYNQIQTTSSSKIDLYHFDSTYQKGGKPYHAKMAMRISNGRPTALLIGSSNLTYAALYGNGSMECDVALYQNQDMFPQYHKGKGVCLAAQTRNDVAEDFIKCFVKDIVQIGIFNLNNRATFLWNDQAVHEQLDIPNPFSAEYLEEVEQVKRVPLKDE